MIFRDSYQPHVLRSVGCLALDCPHSARTVRNLWAPFLKRGQYPLQKVTYWKKTYGCLYKSLVASHSFLKARSKDHVTYATLNISHEPEDNTQGEAVSLILNIHGTLSFWIRNTVRVHMVCTHLTHENVRIWSSQQDSQEHRGLDSLTQCL